MSYQDSIGAIAQDAVRYVHDGNILGLGSGRAAAALVRELGNSSKSVRGIPTSLQIKIVAQKSGIPLLEPDLVSRIDAVFDGADQIDSSGYMIKGGGGALLRESILASMADLVIIMADETKVHRKNSRPPSRWKSIRLHGARRAEQIRKMGGGPSLRVLERG